VCGEHPTIRELIDYVAFCGIGAEPLPPGGAEVTTRELRRELEAGRELVLVDVREPHEWEIVHLEGARLIPLGQLPHRLNELDGHADIVTTCHRGARSLRALEILRAAGFSRVRSLAGGIDAWAADNDPDMARY
jgi:adenylyltransferase/sulfurtransferase